MTKKDVLEILEEMKKQYWELCQTLKATLFNLKELNGGVPCETDEDFETWKFHERQYDQSIDHYSAIGEAIEAVKKEDL